MSDLKLYEYEDVHGAVVTISPGGSPASARIEVEQGTYEAAAVVNAEDIPAVTAAMYEACGLPAPVILSRPQVDGKWKPHPASTLTVSRFGRQVRIEVDAPNSGSVTLPPARARMLAAAIAVLADEADAEPDPADLEALTELIDAEGVVPGRDLAGRLARSLLRGGYRREAAG